MTAEKKQIKFIRWKFCIARKRANIPHSEKKEAKKKCMHTETADTT